MSKRNIDEQKQIHSSPFVNSLTFIIQFTIQLSLTLPVKLNSKDFGNFCNRQG